MAKPTTKTKEMIIAVAAADGNNEYKDIAITPGTQSRDVLSQLGLRGFQLNKPEGGAFAMTDDLYKAIESGQKLYATKADVEAG